MASGTLKSILAPLADLTNRIADAIPQLRDDQLAKACGRLLVTAYQAGARATRRALAANALLTEEALARVAAKSREAARATDRSARLFLGHVHDLYIQPASESVLKVRARKRFVGSLRRYPVEVLQQAERVFRLQVHRSDIRERASYFARLVRDATPSSSVSEGDSAISGSARREMGSMSTASAEMTPPTSRTHPSGFARP